MKRRDEIDVLKALAIGAVAGIHTLAYFLLLYFPGSAQWNRLITLDQIFRFSVPLFVALSGFTLALKYRETSLDLKEFYFRRIFKTLPLYFLWVGATIFISRLAPGGSPFSNGYPIEQQIFLGKADYHLYFVPMIFQLYLTFPVLLYLVKRFPKVLLLVFLIFEICFFQFILPAGHWSDQEQYLFAGSWVFYFVAGIYLAVHETTGKISRFFGLGLLSAGLLWTLGDAFQIIRTGIDPIVATRFTRVSILFYAIGIIWSGSFFGKYLAKLPAFLEKFLTFIGRNSYLIYLSHVLILRIIFEIKRPDQFMGSIPIAIGVVLLAFIGSVWLSVRDRKFKVSK